MRGWPKLKRLDVGGNPIASPPPEIVARGTAAIQAYFAVAEGLEPAPLAPVSEPPVGMEPAAEWSPISWRVKPA